MSYLKNLNLNLGIPSLLPEWKKLFSEKFFLADLFAGTTVAFVAIPLSLAIALASGVSPGTGLVTAIIAGIVCALFGGTTLAVSGPAAAMTILLANVAENYGLPTLVMVCLLVGCMQLLSGIFGLGKLARYVPLPVVAGFTAGIGVIILVGQLPRAFGLEPPDESHVIDVFNHLKQYFHQINGTSFFLVVMTIIVIRGLPKFFPKVPSVLPAVIVTTLIVFLFNLTNVPLIGEIPRTLPAPHFPSLTDVPLNDLLFNAFTIFLLASLETLLSSSALDKLTNDKKHNSNQELIGQGLGNIIVSFFGGIPVTGVIARSATNVRAGAKTRRASIIHSLIILLTVLAIAPFISLIPVAALAGVLFSVAFSMINYHEFYDLWKTSRSEAIIYATTFFTIIFVDLLAGVQAGFIAAALIVLFQAAKTHLHVTPSTEDNMIRLSLTGSLNFISIGKIAELHQRLESRHKGQIVLLDLSNLQNLDTSGATAILDLFNHCNENKIKFYIQGLARRFEPLFKVCGGEDLIENRYLLSEKDLREKDSLNAPKSSRGRLIHGIYRYHLERKHNDKRLFEFISERQDPHTLFITCSDSRIVPTEMTSAEPGELFIIRNVGNFIPPYNPAIQYSEIAALEFALTYLDITDIVVCGHSNCGAMKACCMPEMDSFPAGLRTWIEAIRSQLMIKENAKINDVAKQNVMNQKENLKQYPVIQQKLSAGTLTIHRWFLDFDQSIVYEWDDEKENFHSLIQQLKWEKSF